MTFIHTLVFIIVMGEVDISGYLETRPYLFWGDSVYLTGYNNGWLEMKSGGSNYGLQAALDLMVFYDTAAYSDIFENINIERLALWLGPEDKRVVAGKQRLYWGVGRVFCPLDIFNKTNFFEPGYERAGYNAVLGYLSLSALSSLRAVIAPDRDFDNSLYGMRAGSNIFKNDIGITAMRRPADNLMILGAELTGELIFGYWCEYSYISDDTIDYSKFTLGMDYTFPFRIYLMTEFFFDGSGVTDPADYDFTLVAAGDRSTLAQHYLYSTLSTVPNPFAVIQPSINTLINLDDKSLIIIPQLALSLVENTEVNIGMNYFLGSAETEFQNIIPYDGAVYVWAKVYF
jgi:hypothetical protein